MEVGVPWRELSVVSERLDFVRLAVEGVVPVAELCRREGIAPSVYYKWSRGFLDAGKNGLTRDTKRDATSEEVRKLKDENDALKIALAEATLDVLRFKKNLGML